MLTTLTQKLAGVFKKVRGWGSLTEGNIKEGIREIRLALLEADVSYKVVKSFIDKVTEEAKGEKVLKSLTPSQQFTKIVHDNLVELLGGAPADLGIKSGGISVIMVVGLQGSGKTTTCTKLAQWVEQNFGKKPLVVAADPYRPAAVEQLVLLCRKSQIAVFNRENARPPEICAEALRHAKENSFGAVIIDTAGRLEIDETMMEELVEIKKRIDPHEILLVADAATGQVAVTVAQGFHERIGITGIILSRMDSDARGGAALSMSYVTGRTVSFIGTGEKVEDFERFYPDRIASRILEMGDVVTLVEKVKQEIDVEKAKKLEKKIKKATFDLNDFLDQLKQLKKMGPLENILELIPGVPKKANIQFDETQLVKTEAIINSMTPKEREHYKIINGSRRKRIALGSGTNVYDVNRLLNSFSQMKKMMKKMGKGGRGGGQRGFMPTSFMNRP
ncbi:MAG: signal recognition particle protein [Spirochaetes bacterium]|nr:signal recognition particle protein [Spirochaetota bacterium]